MPYIAPIRLAILSDLHMDTDVGARGRCSRCGQELSVSLPRQTDICSCGRSCLQAGMREGFVAEGELEMLPSRRPWGRMALEAGVDAVVLLGDTRSGPESIRWAAEEFTDLPVVAIAGNREFYGGERTARLAELRHAASCSHVIFLECDTVEMEIRGQAIRMLGATLWTDFRVIEPQGMCIEHALAQTNARLERVRREDPHHMVTCGDRPFMAEDMRSIHLETREWMHGELARAFDGCSAVFTHHAPLLHGAAEKFGGGPATAGCYSDLSGLLEHYSPEMVAWGHTHAPDVDLVHCGMRSVSHQRGYTWEADVDYAPKIVEISRHTSG
jgi:predicted phosphodiesterase